MFKENPSASDITRTLKNWGRELREDGGMKEGVIKVWFDGYQSGHEDGYRKGFSDGVKAVSRRITVR